MQLSRQTRTIISALAVVGTLGTAITMVAAIDTTHSASISTAGQPDQPVADVDVAPDGRPPVPGGTVDPPERVADEPPGATGTDPTAHLAVVAPDGVDGAAVGEPTEFVDTEPIVDTPGVITRNADIPAGPPPSPAPAMQVAQLVAVPKPAPTPTPPPAVDPIDLLEVGGNGPVEPAIVATDFQVPVDDSVGDFATAEHGCALACVTKAILTPAGTSSHLDVETNVPARIDITLTNTDNGQTSLFTSSGFKTKWSTTLSPLTAGTEYDLLLEAFDQDGQRRIHTHTFRTNTPVQMPGQYQDERPGCAGTCITRATVTPTDRHDEVRFDIETNTPASVTVWMSASEPGWIDDTPLLPAAAIVEPTLGIRTEFSVEKAFLDDATTYHVIVRAADDFGVEYQVGEFHTGPPAPVDVLLTFEQIFVQWDGDPYWGGLDRGELSFAWGLDDGDLSLDDVVGWRGRDKMDGGTTVVLGGLDAEVWQRLDEDDVFLSPGVTAHERDRLGCFACTAIDSLLERPEDRGGHGRSNPAWGPRLTLDGIRAQQTCGEMGVDTAPPNDYCVSFQTTKHPDDREYPNIAVIVSYHLDT